MTNYLTVGDAEGLDLIAGVLHVDLNGVLRASVSLLAIAIHLVLDSSASYKIIICHYSICVRSLHLFYLRSFSIASCGRGRASSA